MQLKNKKVLLMGLGVLGGGVATAIWLIKQGADLTITDLKTKNDLKSSLEELKDFDSKIKYILGEHRERDFLDNEIIVINPDVSVNNKFVKLAKENGKQIENELTLFYKFCPSNKIIAITGTRGKTTTTNWIYHFLKAQYLNVVLAGNSATNQFLKMINKCDKDSFVVIEVPSYHLELMEEKNYKYAPKIAVITNIYQDHLNRHRDLKNYAKVKANIFKNQIKNDFLILNQEDKWTKFFLSFKPKAKVLFFSKKNNFDFISKWGEHNLENLSAAILTVKNIGVRDDVIKKAVLNLPQIKYREEKIYEDKKIEIWNDSAATSPEAGIAAVKRFNNNQNFVLIAGGTDKELDFKEWAKIIKQKVKLENLILLSGSATNKMKKEIQNFSNQIKFAIGWERFKIQEYETLKECLEKALIQSRILNGKVVIIFSPASKSFEKFKNEYDRGEQFNSLIKKLLNKK